ncbi:MAG TPA: lysylphosphatidylglycerol synthase transmembrane domain-containing protein [Candidatus Saccharimonadales bacterium]|nr:lysylphosphatidylglycerol synthase transmembrane domain-containing protein [Candidatus Saccharimonadales bacterium]
MAARQTKKAKANRNVIYAAYLVFGLLLLYLAITQQQELWDSVDAIKNADFSLIGLSLAFQLGTYLSAAMVYKMIAIRKLPYFKTLLVQVGSSFTNRLLPAGTGRLATFGDYLVKQGHSVRQAAAIVAVNNLLGFVGLMILTVSSAFISNTPLSSAISYRIPAWLLLVIVGATATAIISVSFYQPMFNKTKKAARGLATDFKLITKNPLRLLGGLVSSMFITIFFWAILYASIYAMGQSATVLQTFIVLTIGVAAANITPTPGGVGGAEAGLVAALNSIGISPDAGIGIALIYRLITFWLPIIPGFLCFRLALRRRLL